MMSNLCINLVLVFLIVSQLLFIFLGPNYYFLYCLLLPFVLALCLHQIKTKVSICPPGRVCNLVQRSAYNFIFNFFTVLGRVLKFQGSTALHQISLEEY